jgi:hypothetical protein
MVDEQWHDLTVEDSAPAAAYQVTPAVGPPGRSKSGVLRNTGLIGVAGLLFGVLGAMGLVLNRVGVKKADAAFRISEEGVENHLPAQGSNAAGRVERENLIPAESPAGREPLSNGSSARALFEPEVVTAATAVALFTAPAAPTFAPAAVVESAVCLASAETSVIVAETAEAEPSTGITAPMACFAPEKVASTFAELAMRFSSSVATPAVGPFVAREVADVAASNPLPAWREEPPVAANGSVPATKECEPARDPEPATTAAKLEPERPWWLMETPVNPEPAPPPPIWEPSRMWTARRTSADPAVQPVAVDFRAELQRLTAAAEQFSNRWPGLEDAPRAERTLAPRPGRAPEAELEEESDYRSSQLSELRNRLLVMVAKNGSGGDGAAERRDG